MPRSIFFAHKTQYHTYIRPYKAELQSKKRSFLAIFGGLGKKKKSKMSPSKKKFFAEKKIFFFGLKSFLYDFQAILRQKNFFPIFHMRKISLWIFFKKHVFWNFWKKFFFSIFYFSQGKFTPCKKSNFFFFFSK